MSWIAKLFGGKKEMQMLMIGLDHAGKSTIVSGMQLGKPTTTAIKPTIGFSLEEIVFENFKLKMWDISGQEKYRQLWKHYYEGAKGIVFVVDSADRERLPEVKDELQKVLVEQDLSRMRMLIIANKQDLPGALRAKEIRDALGIPFEHESKIRIQEASAKRYEGLLEGFTWLVHEIETKLSK